MSTPRGKVKVGVIGSQFQADIHCASFRMTDNAEVVAIASPTPGNAEKLARQYGVGAWYLDYREMLADPEIEMVTPKYVKAKEMADEGAFGQLYLVKQSEKHYGPHAPWFWDVDQSGGGVLMDMGCHGIAFVWWFLGRPKLKSVLAQGGTYVHADKTRGDDNCFVLLEFEDDKGNQMLGMVEDSWARTGGMDDRIEVYGSQGCTYGNLHMGNALPTYSNVGFGYAVEKADTTVGWTYPVFEELWNYGFPQEMRHFAAAVRGEETLQCSGEDGRFVQNSLFAAYQSMGTGAKVSMPFDARGVAKPIDLWFSPRT